MAVFDLLQPQYTHPHTAASLACAQAGPSLPHDSCLTIFGSHFQLLLHRDYRCVQQAQHATAKLLLQFAKQTVILREVAIANVSLAPVPLFFPHGPLAASTFGHLRSHRPAAQDLIIQMQPHRLVFASTPRPIKSPRHPRQRCKERAIACHPLLSSQARIGAALVGQLAGQFFEYPCQQLRLEQMLGLRETAQTHMPPTNLLLHTLQIAGRAQCAHGPDHRIEQPEKVQTQVIAQRQHSFGILKRRMRSKLLLNLGQALLELLQQFPIRQIAGRYRLVRRSLRSLWHEAI